LLHGAGVEVDAGAEAGHGFFFLFPFGVVRGMVERECWVQIDVVGEVDGRGMCCWRDDKIC
jgi:hypothetical protein